MTPNARRTQDSTAVRPPTVFLGVDSAGAHHVYRTRTETVHVVHPDRGRTHTERLRGRHADEWMAFVADRRGWARRDYGVGFTELMRRAGVA